MSKTTNLAVVDEAAPTTVGVDLPPHVEAPTPADQAVPGGWLAGVEWA